jgi:polyhydroxybutyrate depolymerase
MRRILLALLAVTTLAVTGCASLTTAAATQGSVVAASRATTHSIKVDGRTRTWLQVAPVGSSSATVPIIVMLSGISATAGKEMARDGLLGLPAAGRAELVYPVAIDESWNVGNCCGKAAKLHIDDQAFIEALASKLDPAHHRPIYLAGYSNGGRLAYLIACTTPTLFTGYAVVKAMPDVGCVVTKPVSILQIDSTNDYAVPYKPGDKGKEHPPATTEVADLRTVDACPTTSTTQTRGTLTLTTWTNCKSQSRVTFATYIGGKHSWPPDTSTTPGAATLIWTFITKTPLPPT